MRTRARQGEVEALWGKLTIREKELNMSKIGARDLSHAVKSMKTALERGRKEAKAMRERLAALEVRRCVLLVAPIELTVHGAFGGCPRSNGRRGGREHGCPLFLSVRARRSSVRSLRQHERFALSNRKRASFFVVGGWGQGSVRRGVVLQLG